MRKRILQTLAIMVSGIMVLLALGGVYQRIAIEQDVSNFPPPGERIDVSGYRLHLHCIGAGEPTLIVDTGAADWSLSWLTLQQDLAKLTRTCVYDRAGLGWSDAGDMPRTSTQLVDELHTLLINADVQAPVVLMGHSLGGYNARLYFERYPEAVAGMILLESAHEDQWDQFPKEVEDLVNQQVGLLNTMAPLANVGLVRFILPEHEHLDAAYQGAYRAHMARGQHLTAAASELGGGIVSAQQVPQGDLGDLPLVVITAANSFDAFRAFAGDLPFAEAEQIWQTLQADLTNLSSNSVHLVSPDADHNIHFTGPSIVIEGVRQLLSMLAA